ncbi:MAG TPA: hypothetical protein VFK56_07140 [Mycobacterium sp.]|nr:hypothetical protein [Mycobacterium sp.]
MPDDLLRFVGGTPPYSPWWLWSALALFLLVTLWLAFVVVWTLPSQRLRRIPLVRSVHRRVLRSRFTRNIRKVVECHRSGSLSTSEAGARISRTLRSFLHQATGTPAQYMHVDAIEASDLSAAAPVFVALNDAQFSRDSAQDVGHVGEAAEELIRTWS